MIALAPGGSGFAGVFAAVPVLVAIPFVLLVPGYTLLAAFGSGRALTGAERLALSVGLSLAADIVAGLFLNLTPIGLTRSSWLVTLAGLSLAFIVVAASRAIRAERLPHLPSLSVPVRVAIGRSMMVGVAVILTIGAVWIAHAGAVKRTGPGFAQVWMVASKTKRANRVGVVVRSHASFPQHGRVTVTAGSRVLQRAHEFTLVPDGRWSDFVSLPLTRPVKLVATVDLRGRGGWTRQTVLRWVGKSSVATVAPSSRRRSP